jgi:8-oxo-dGTP pyrophosphatase MutT (NUDIX family)
VLAVGQSNSDNANMTRTPNAASVALIEKDRVLLIQRNRTPYFGMWSLPGGRLEPGESAETAAVREVREETGLTCFRLTPVRRMLLAEGRFALQVFATEGFEGEITPSDEIADWRWVRSWELAGIVTTPDLAAILEAAFRLFDRT